MSLSRSSRRRLGPGLVWLLGFFGWLLLPAGAVVAVGVLCVVAVVVLPWLVAGVVLVAVVLSGIAFVAPPRLLAGVLLTIGALCAVAIALPPRLIAGEGSGSGQVADPTGVALLQEPNGGVDVADSAEERLFNDRVDAFGNGGGFLKAFGWGVADGGERLEVCVSECQEGLRGAGAGEFSLPQGVAVDGVAGVGHGDVLVSDKENFRVQEFTEAGGFVLMFGGGVNKTTGEDVCTAVSHDLCGVGEDGAGPGELGNSAAPVAVDGAGDVWVGDVERLEEFSVATGALVGEVPLSGLGTIESLAVGPGPAEDFYAIGSGEPGVQKVGPLGERVETLDGSGSPRSVTAVDGGVRAGEVFVSDQEVNAPGQARLLEYSSSGEEQEVFAAGQVVGEPQGDSLAYDEPRGTLLVSSHRGGKGLTGGGEGLAAVQEFGLPGAGPLVAEGSVKALPVRVTSATLNATVDPEGAETSYRLVYIAQAGFEANVEAGRGGFTGATVAGEGSLPEEFGEDAVSARVEGLTPDTGYRFCVLAENTNGAGNASCSSIEDEGTFSTLPAVEVSAESVAGVTAESASLLADVNPLGFVTEYRFEYLPEAAYRANVAAGREGFSGASVTPAPDGLVGASEEDHQVAESVRGLSPDTFYRYRLLAHDRCNPQAPEEECVVVGAALAFVTQQTVSSSELVLPDGREWEMVSPPDKHGALIEPITGNAVVQAARDGEAFTYAASGGAEEDASGNARLSQFLARRTGSGWVSEDIAVSHGGATKEAAGAGQDYRFFDENLNVAVVEPFGAFSPYLSPRASEQTPYLRSDFAGENVGEPCTRECYLPLVTGEEGYADVPAGTVFGHQGGSNPGETPVLGPQFQDASPDGSHVVLFSKVPLTETGLPAGGGLYEWSAGRMTLVSVLPRDSHGEEPLAGEPGLGEGLPSRVEAPLDDVDKRGAISADGSLVVFTDYASGGLFVRDVPQGRTVQVDTPQAGCGGCEAAGGGVFQLAIEAGGGRGERILFGDERRLTSDAGAKQGAPDLYECELVEGPGGVECVLSDLTPKTRAGESAGVQGYAIGASSDGSWLYFVAHGVLSENVGPVGQRAVAGANNLYVWHDGAVSLVAVLAGQDRGDWGVGAGGHPRLDALTARVSGDGEWLVFMSAVSLTGFDNEDVSSRRAGERVDEEVFLFDAAAGEVACVSCDVTGGRPAGVEVTGQQTFAIPRSVVWPVGTWLAADVPGWTPFAETTALFGSRVLSADGRVFFDSSDALVPQDVDGVGDVYEWEPVGVGGCSASTAAGVFRPGRVFGVEGRGGVEPAGCVGLISSGASGGGEAGFLDASESGSDVFFLTGDRLSGADFDTNPDVYDAHECSGAAPCLPVAVEAPGVCVTADACRAAPSPQPSVFGAPSSATFSGPGNPPPPPAPAVKPKAKLSRAQKLAAALRACRRDRSRHKRLVCEAGARKRFGPRKKAHRKARKSGVSAGRGR